MFNFAAAVSERIRNFRSTKVETFVPDVEDEFSAKGGGDKIQCYQATNQPSTSEKGCISVDLPGGGLQLMRGDTGQGEQITDQATCTDSVLRGEVHRGERCSPVGDGRNVKPPLVRGPHLRRLLPLRTKLCPRRISKVHPLDESLLTQQSFSLAKDSANNTQFPALSTPASTFLNGGQQSVGKSSHQTSANNERIGSVSTTCVETTLPSIDQGQTALTCNGRSRKPWTERLRTFLLPRRQHKTTPMLSSNNTPEESTDTPPKSFDNQNECGTRNQGTLVSKQIRSTDVEHKEFRPAPPKGPNHRKGQVTRKPMRCIGVVSGNERPVATPTVAPSAPGVTFPTVNTPSKKPKGLAEYDDETHTVESSLHDILSPSFTTASKQLPPVRGIAKTNYERLPAICLKDYVFSQSIALSSSKKNDKKCQQYISESSSGLNNEPPTSLLPSINVPKHNSSSKSKKLKTKRVRRERVHTDEKNKNAVAMVTESSGPSSSIKIKSSDDGTKEQKECLPEICLKGDAFSQSIASSSSKTKERKCQDFGKLSSTTFTKEQEDPQDCLPEICFKGDIFSQSVASSSSKCQDVCHFPPCSSALNNGPSTSILPSIAFPEDSSSSKLKDQTIVRVRHDRLKTDGENKDAVKQSCGPSSPIITTSLDDDIKEQETSQDPVREEKNHFSLREQKIALELDVKYVHENNYVQWEWLKVIESCLERADELHNGRAKGAKDAPMIPVEIAEEIYKNADIASEKLDQLFELKGADLGSDSEMSPPLFKKSPAKSSRSQAKKCRNKRHTKSTKKQRPAAEESAGRSSRARDHDKQSVGETVGKCNQEDLGTTLGPQCGLSVQQKVLPQIVPSGFQRPSNGLSTGEAETYTKCAKLSHRPKKGLPDMSSYPLIEAADLEHVISWNGSKVMLGKGSTANVFLMRRRSDGTLLAVKKMKSDCIRVTYDEAMLTEVTALRDVGHSRFLPKLLGLIDYRSFALELVGNGSANSVQDFGRARFSSKNPLSCLEWLHVCRDVTAGLMSLHNAGWLHNDLHAGNVVVCRTPSGSEVAWTGKVIDLGCAQRIDHPLLPCALTQEEKLEVYQNATQVAPEVIEGLTGFTVKSDTYSLGKVFESTVGCEGGSLSSVRRIGLSCASRDPAKRPKLKYVYRKLKALCRKKMAEEKRSPSP